VVRYDIDSPPHAQNVPPPSSCASSLDDGIVEQRLHELLKCLIGWLVSEKTHLLKSIYAHNLDQELMLTDIELFLSDEHKLRGLDAFEKWILSDASRRYENPSSFGSGMEDKAAKLLCVLKRLNYGTELSTQIRLFRCRLNAQAPVPPVAHPAASAASSNSFNRAPRFQCPVCQVIACVPSVYRTCHLT